MKYLPFTKHLLCATALYEFSVRLAATNPFDRLQKVICPRSYSHQAELLGLGPPPHLRGSQGKNVESNGSPLR